MNAIQRPRRRQSENVSRDERRLNGNQRDETAAKVAHLLVYDAEQAFLRHQSALRAGCTLPPSVTAILHARANRPLSR